MITPNRLHSPKAILQIIILTVLIALPTYLISAQTNGPDEVDTIEPIETDIDKHRFMPIIMNNPIMTPEPPAEPRSYGEVVTVTYGVNFINSVDQPADASQFAAGKLTGATWNRWPLYWPRIETGEGVFDWAEHDEVIQGDIDNGFLTNAILLGTPGFYISSLQLAPSVSAEGETGDSFGAAGEINLNRAQTVYPRGLRDPIFSDGSDKPGAGKTLNPDNKWAIFVYTIVDRYKPGGVLAQQNGWADGVGITHWEMWNEPDYINFWAGTVEDYARLLKVGYIAAKEADPNSEILFGGLANIDQPNFYTDVLTIFSEDPQAAANAYYHDILATHAYSYAWNSWFLTFKANRTLNQFDLDKPIWLNETGVPAWDDYPGPIWDSKSGFRSTMSEQSDYTIQHTFYGLYAGADAIFHFQLYDGCGNQPAGTDFPPHGSELCDSSGNYNGKPCAGDAFGLFRNQSTMACFTQHPEAGTPRPYLSSYQFLTQYLTDVAPYWRQRLGDDDDNPVTGTIEVIALYKPSTQERIVGVWTLSGQNQSVEIEATSTSAQLYDVAGNAQTIVPTNGVYTLQLQGATNQNFPADPNLWMIGGRPLVLIEEDLTAETP
ncbi:MAG: hypothetical protein AAF633_14330 [Chloroflexota bacterium]